MPNTFIPSQLGWTQTGSANGSQIVLGKDLTVGWEAAGFGKAGRPDILEKVVINLTNTVQNPDAKRGSISIDVADLMTVIEANPENAPSVFRFELRQMDVCDNGIAKKIMVLASQTYSPPPPPP